MFPLTEDRGLCGYIGICGDIEGCNVLRFEGLKLRA